VSTTWLCDGHRPIPLGALLPRGQGSPGGRARLAHSGTEDRRCRAIHSERLIDHVQSIPIFAGAPTSSGCSGPRTNPNACGTALLRSLALSC